ncbi:hypothetical protein V6N13_096333 [Hibiscus sabdariffa]
MNPKAVEQMEKEEEEGFGRRNSPYGSQETKLLPQPLLLLPRLLLLLMLKQYRMLQMLVMVRELVLVISMEEITITIGAAVLEKLKVVGVGLWNPGIGQR